jgi:hypothetical protein
MMQVNTQGSAQAPIVMESDDDNAHEEEDWSISGSILEPQIDEEEGGSISTDASLDSLDYLYDMPLIPQDSGSEVLVSNAFVQHNETEWRAS